MTAIEKIRKIIVDELAVEESDVVEDANLLDDLDADSMNLLVIYSEIEKAFKIKIDDEVALEIKTVADILKLIDE